MKSQRQPLRTLLVEDSEDDALLLIEALRRGGYEPEWRRVQTEPALREALTDREWDVVFCDYGMPHFDAPAALRILRETGDALTVIVVSGQVGEEVAVESMRLGANDFILKGNLGRVVPAMERELRSAEIRRKSEEARRISEEHLRLVLEAANDGVWESDFATGKLIWSERMYEMLGLSPDVFAPTIEAFAALIHPEDRAHFEQAQREVRRDGGRFHSETRIRRSDGTYGHFLGRGRAVTDAVGRPVRMVGSTTDVTKILRAEEKIREQAALLDHAQDAIIVRDLRGMILYWNKSAERVFGWPAEEAIGCREREMLHKNPDSYDVAFEKLLASGEWIGELTKRTKSGDEALIEARWTLVRDKSGEPKTVLSINTDITEKKKLEAQFFRAQRMESIGTLAGGIAHDLNNVFGPIVMAVDLFKLTMTDPQQVELLEMVESSAQRGADMVKQILFFARGLESKRAIISAVKLVGDLRKMAMDTFPKSILLETFAPQDTWKISGDFTQLYQVLLNLCVNARDAMPAGGLLTVTARNEMIDADFVAKYPEATFGPFVILEVADTGEGIPPRVMERVFEPFFTTKEIGKGTGLGLSTSLAIVKNHEGFITVENRVGGGTVFQVGLPAVLHPVEAPFEAVPKELLRGAGDLILIIDDESAILSFTGQTLEAFGYRVLTATNGAEGTVKYAQYMGEIGAVLTDMTMPVMDGATTIRELMRIDPSVKIIAASGLSAKGVETAAGEGVRHFLAKPYSAETMLRTLHEVLHPKLPQ